MGTDDINNLAPAEVFPPGEFIRDELEARGWTQQDLADILGVAAPSLNLIITGKRSITTEMAKALGNAFGTSAELWLNLESGYQLSKAGSAKDSIARRSRLYSIAPVGEMSRRGWIETTTNIDVQESNLRKFFACQSLDAIPPLQMAARMSADYGETSPAQRAWGYRVLTLGRAVQASVFDPDKVAAEIPRLRSATLYPEAIREIPRLLASWGIRLVLVQHLERTKVDGATLWLDQERTMPVIGLSMRFDRIDWFWFTLIHELTHVKYREFAIDSDLIADAKGEGGTSNVDEIEARANREAASALVPQDKLESFIIRKGPMFSRDSVIQFAKLHAVHPGIVVGQLHHRKVMPSKNLRDLLVQNGVRCHILGQTITDGWGHSPGVL